jgi:hypothetical protein
MQLDFWTWTGAADLAPAYRVDGPDVYDLLRANRFDAARDAVKTWRTDNPIREMVETGRYQDAICALGSVLFPKQPDRAGWPGARFRQFERALADH